MSYVELRKTANELVIRLTEVGREFLQEQRDGIGWKRGTLYIFQDLLEDWLASGWEFIRPEEISALTAAPILSDEARRNDAGELTGIGTLYWFPAYAVTNEIEELLAEGQVVFVNAA